MKYTIIIPAYQCADTIRITVMSLMNSGLKDYEIVIIDDGSKDDTALVCKSLSKKYENINYFYQNNQGVSSARNHGLEKAQGEYVWFFDSDDTVDVNSLINVDNAILQYNPDMVIFGMSFDYYYNGKMYRRDIMSYTVEEFYCTEDVKRCFNELYVNNYLTPAWNKIIRKSILERYHIQFKTDFFLLEDFLFSLDCVDHCDSFYLMPDVIYRYRQPEDEGNAYRRLARIQDLNRFIKPFRKKLSNHPEVLSQVYYMLLEQKLWNADLKEIQQIAEIHEKCDIIPVSTKDKTVAELLIGKRYSKIYWNNRKLKIRHKIAVIVKQSVLYKYVLRMKRNEKKTS